MLLANPPPGMISPWFIAGHVACYKPWLHAAERHCLQKVISYVTNYTTVCIALGCFGNWGLVSFITKFELQIVLNVNQPWMFIGSSDLPHISHHENRVCSLYLSLTMLLLNVFTTQFGWWLLLRGLIAFIPLYIIHAFGGLIMEPNRSELESLV